MALLEVSGLEVTYESRFGRGGHRALRGVDLQLKRGETLGVVGESGCGKSTLAKAILGLVQPTHGSVKLDGTELSGLSTREMRPFRKRLQMVFQDPIDSLNPRQRVGDAIVATLRLNDVHGDNARQKVSDALAAMGLDPDLAFRRPHELSGGQAQRIGLARALILDPELVVFDEPTSALDVSVQAQLLELIRGLTRGGDRGYIYISHDLGTVRGLCHRVAVMYLGTVVEEAPVEKLFSNPLHPYTCALLSSVHSLHGALMTRKVILSRNLDEADAVGGCSLSPRCPHAEQKCGAVAQELVDFGAGHRAACCRIPELERSKRSESEEGATYGRTY